MSTHDRRMTINEMLKFQGFPPGIYDWEALKVARTTFSGSIGNAMSVCVLERLLPRAFVAAGILDTFEDDWESPEFVKKRRSLRQIV